MALNNHHQNHESLPSIGGAFLGTHPLQLAEALDFPEMPSIIAGTSAGTNSAASQCRNSNSCI